MRFAENLVLFDLTTEANLIRIFTKKDWTLAEKKLWCGLVQYLFNQNKINEPLFIQKLEEKNALQDLWDSYERYINCGFLDKSPVSVSVPEIDIDEEEIPF